MMRARTVPLCLTLVLAASGCGRRAERVPADETPVQRGPRTVAETRPSGEGEGAPASVATGEFAVLDRDAPLWADRQGTPVPTGDASMAATLATNRGDPVLRVVGRDATRVQVETVPSTATPTPGCGVGIVAIDALALRVWVDAARLREVVTRRTRLPFPDGTEVELLAGTPVRRDDEGIWQAHAWGVVLDLPEAPPDRGFTFGGLDYLTGSVKAHLPMSQALRVGDYPLPNLELRSDRGGIQVFGEEAGMVWLQFACAQVLAAVEADALAGSLGSLSGSGVGGRGYSHPNYGVHVVEKGAPLFWRDGNPAGEARDTFVFAGHRERGAAAAPDCYWVSLGSGRGELQLCPDPKQAREVPWLDIERAEPASVEGEVPVDGAAGLGVLRVGVAEPLRRCVAVEQSRGATLVDGARVVLAPRTTAESRLVLDEVGGRVFEQAVHQDDMAACVLRGVAPMVASAAIDAASEPPAPLEYEVRPRARRTGRRGRVPAR